MQTVMQTLDFVKNSLLDPTSGDQNTQIGHVGLALFSILVISFEYFICL